jgi:predicted CXXCH cytochrome family protein
MRMGLYTLLLGILMIAGVMFSQTPSTSRAAASGETIPHYGTLPYQDGGDDEDTQDSEGTDDEAAQDSDVESESEAPSSGYCLLCHSQADRTLELPSGESLSLTIDRDALANSVHGDSNPSGYFECSACHGDYRYPHEPISSQTRRDYTLERYATCRSCHEDQYTHSQDGVHALAIQDGKVDAATCVDCHGAHDVQAPSEPRERISLTCGQCHGAIFDEYRTSVHGEALFQGNADVPTCIDCHGVHGIQNPTTAQFRVRSPQLCADCHADEELMGKYDINTHVFDSYLTDFHGSTVALFDQQDPTIETNKAVCYDCHGVHNISPADNFKSQVAKENLLITCQQCHPDARDDFPDAWVGHFQPTAEENPALFAVTWFYRIIIPLTVGGFLFLVGTDVFGRVRRRLFGSGR